MLSVGNEFRTAARWHNYAITAAWVAKRIIALNVGNEFRTAARWRNYAITAAWGVRRIIALNVGRGYRFSAGIIVEFFEIYGLDAFP